MRIEPVGEHNVANVVGLGRELVTLGSFGNTIGFDWDHAMRNTLHAMRSVDYYIRVALDDNGAYCGFIGGHMDTFFFSPVRYGQEDAWYVREGTPFRAKIAFSLMRGFVDWCITTNRAKLVQSGDVAAINTVAVDGLYTRLGFRRFGTIYKYEREA